MMKIRKLPLIMALAVMLLLPGTGKAQGQEAKPGGIQGSLSYPSEFIPSDMVVCAENLATGKQYCTERQIKSRRFATGVGYRLELPPGDYHVYAYLPDPAKIGADYPRDYRAYYSEFVTCGMTVDCPSHKPIVVKVRSGQTLNKIDPQDWYNFK